jgi:hypothetical protein
LRFLCLVFSALSQNQFCGHSLGSITKQPEFSKTVAILPSKEFCKLMGSEKSLSFKQAWLKTSVGALLRFTKMDLQHLA